MSEVLIERLKVEDYLPPRAEDLVYVDAMGLMGRFDKWAFNRDLVLVGPHGNGKSLSVQYWTARLNAQGTVCPLVTAPCSTDTRRSHMFGMFNPRGAEVPFILGPIPTAFELANECGQCVLNFEEVNALDPNAQKLLNMVTDLHRRAEVPEARKVFRLRKGARLWVACTMNEAVYGGVYALNADLKSRMRVLPLGYPAPKTEKQILSAVINGSKTRLPEKAIDNAVMLAHETRQKALDYVLGTRDIVQILEDILTVGEHDALWAASGKFEGDDRSFFKERVKSLFGVEIKE